MNANKAIVISTHILEEVEAVCSRAVVIARGKLLLDGSSEELIASAPNHNALVISLGPDHVNSATAVARGMPEVRKVEVLDDEDEDIRIRVFPRDAVSLLLPVGDAMKAANIDVRQLYIERGTLDSVFRNITTFRGTGETTNA